MPTFQRRHEAATGAKAGQYVPCTAELQCTLANSSHVSGTVFEATKQWLGRDGVRITNADVSPGEVARFKRSDDYLEYVDRAEQQKQAQKQQDPASVKESPARTLVAVGQLRKGDVVVFSDGDAYTSPKRVQKVEAKDGFNVRVTYVDDANPSGLALSTTIWHTTPINRLEKPARKEQGTMADFFGGEVPAAQVVPAAQPRITDEELSELMDFGYTVVSDGSGAVAEGDYATVPQAEGIQYVDLDTARGVGELYAPDGWEYLTGFSNQYGYDGALMHESEDIGGGLADYIRDNPGLYAAVQIEGVYAFETDAGETGEPVGWGILRKVDDGE